MRRIVFPLLLIVAVAGCKRGEQKAPETTSGKTTTESAATTTEEPAPPGIDVGSTMPAYTASNLDGTTFDVASVRDKVVLLNLWATWCGPCRYEIPELQRMHDAYKERGFEVIGVSVDEGSVDSVKEFAAEQKMTYPIVLDPQGQLATMLQTSVLPTTILLDRKGKILWKKYGAILENDPELKSVIEKAL